MERPRIIKLIDSLEDAPANLAGYEGVALRDAKAYVPSEDVEELERHIAIDEEPVAIIKNYFKNKFGLGRAA
jgi:hypothetical protein